MFERKWSFAFPVPLAPNTVSLVMTHLDCKGLETVEFLHFCMLHSRSTGPVPSDQILVREQFVSSKIIGNIHSKSSTKRSRVFV